MKKEKWKYIRLNVDDKIYETDYYYSSARYGFVLIEPRWMKTSGETTVADVFGTYPQDLANYKPSRRVRARRIVG